MRQPDYNMLREANEEYMRKEKLSVEEKYKILNAMHDFAESVGAFSSSKTELISKEKINFIKRLHGLPRTHHTDSK